MGLAEAGTSMQEPACRGFEERHKTADSGPCKAGMQGPCCGAWSPARPPANRPPVAARWLASHAPELSEADRDAIATTVFGVIATHADLFGPEALAEAPIAAVVEGVVIAGKVDRLLVGETSVRLVDFKTGRRVPADAASVETYYLKQMAAYVAALRAIFPGREIAAALLYTHDATLIDLPAALLAAHAPQLGGHEETLPVVER